MVATGGGTWAKYAADQVVVLSECAHFRQFSDCRAVTVTSSRPGIRALKSLPPASLPDHRLHPVVGWLLAGLLITCVLAAGIGLRLPLPPDEPRFVLAAQTMLDTGNWLLPHRGTELYAEKPPVFMWLQAASLAATGHWRGAFLLPSLLAALLTLWLTGDIAARLWGKTRRLPAMLALLCCIQFVLMAKRAQIDMLLMGLTTLSLWALVRYLSGRPARRWLLLAGVAAGIGTVTKGVGFLPLLAVLPWLFARWRWPAGTGDGATAGHSAWPLLWLLPALLLGTLVWLGPLLWALWQHPSQPLQAYAAELLFKQTGTRYARAWHHIQPAWYYLQVMATLWLPAALLLPWLLPAWWRQLRAGEPRQWLMLGWALLVLLFFSASPGKREVYLLPMLPALCVAAAPLLPELLCRRAVRAVLLGWSLLLGTLLLAMGALASQHHSWLLAQLLHRGMPAELLGPLGQGLLAAGTAIIVLCALTRMRHVLIGLLGSLATLWLLHGLLIMPLLSPYSSARVVMARAGQVMGPDAELGLVAWREQNLLQADRAAVDFGFKRPVAGQWQAAQHWLQQAPQQRWLLVLDKALDPCVDPARVQEVGSANRNRWLLLPGTAIRADCGLQAAPGPEEDED